MDEQVDLALRVLPDLNVLVDRVLDLSHRVGARHLGYEGLEHNATARAGYMALSYVGKQDEHLQSLRMLIHAGQHRDAWLIARTMTEGLAQLLWAYGHQPEGPDEWYWYEVVEDWRQMQTNKRNGVLVEPETEAAAGRLLSQFGTDYYSSRAKKSIAEGKALPADPYRHKWTDLDAASIFSQVRGARLYETIYRRASDWAHWSPRSISLGFTDDGDIKKFVLRDPRRAAQALAAGVLSLLQSLETVNNHFKIGIEGELAIISEELEKVLDRVVPS